MSELRGKGKEEKVNSEVQQMFRAAVGSVNWVSGNTRPDLAYEVMELSMKFGRATVQDVRQASRLLKRAREQSNDQVREAGGAGGPECAGVR